MAVLTQPRSPGLDSVRAIAALSVLVFHAGFWSKITLTGSAAAPFLSRLDVGVAIFFVLSGFLLYRPFVRARLLGAPPPRVLAFGWRRVLRILPAYWLALTVIAIALPLEGVFEPGNAAVYYGFLQVYGDLALGGIPQAWSLCVEVTFYALLPLWALALARAGGPRSVRSELWALAGLAAVGIAWSLVAVLGATDPDHANASRMLVWLPAYLDQFALGMALAVLAVSAERDGRTPRAVAWVERRPWTAWLGALAAFVLVAVGIGLPTETRLDAPMTAAQTLARHWLYAAVAVGVLLPVVFGPPGRGAIGRVLAHPVPLFLGTISYGIFLWHNAPMQRLSRAIDIDGSWADFAVLLAAGLGVGIAAAALSWFLLERPILRLRRLVADRAPRAREQPAAADPAPAAAPSGR
jgi:peptidoglycan/LPS O-acetylase OafA/YrhL